MTLIVSIKIYRYNIIYGHILETTHENTQNYFFNGYLNGYKKLPGRIRSNLGWSIHFLRLSLKPLK